MSKPESVFDQLDKNEKPDSKAVGVAPSAPVTKTPEPGLDNNLLANLVSLMITEQSEKLQVRRDAEARNQVRQAQRDRNSKDQDSKRLVKQARCRHLKGGKHGPKTGQKDYAVYQFVLINSVQFIRCRICGMKWFPKDTPEYLVRVDGKGKEQKIANHTKAGWAEAFAYTEQSSDTPGSSERVQMALPGTAQGYTDSTGLPVLPRIVNLDGEAVSDIQI